MIIDRKRAVSISIFAAFALSLGALSARAEAPSVLTYQGRLQEAGALVTANRDVEIKLCQDAVGTGCVATGVNSVNVVNGLFRTTFTTNIGLPDLAAPGKNWFLELNVGPVGGGRTVLLPREQLTSSAFAVVAATANYLYAPNFGPGPLAVINNLPGAGVLFSVGGSTLTAANGNVGVGTNNPLALLHVVGTMPNQMIQLESSVAGGNPAMMVRSNNPAAGPASLILERQALGAADIQFNTTGANDWRFRVPSSSNSLNLFDQNLNPVMTWTKGHTIGFGTSSPQALILNYGNGKIGSLLDISDPNVARLNMHSSGGQEVALEHDGFGLNVVVAGNAAAVNNVVRFNIGPTASAFNNTPVLRLTNYAVQTSTTVNSQGSLSVQGAGAAFTMQVSTDNNGFAPNFVVDTTGKIGIGTSNPAELLEINGRSTGAHMAANQVTAPTIGTTCGGAAPAVTAGSTDMSGSFTFSTGGGGGNCSTTLTFNSPYSAAPKSVILTAGNAAAATFQVQIYISATNTTNFVMTNPINPAVGPLTYYYFVVQ